MPFDWARIGHEIRNQRHDWGMDQEKPPSDWEVFQNQSTTKKVIFGILIVVSIWLFPPVIFFYVPYWIYKKRQRGK